MGLRDWVFPAIMQDKALKNNSNNAMLHYLITFKKVLFLKKKEIKIKNLLECTSKLTCSSAFASGAGTALLRR